MPLLSYNHETELSAIVKLVYLAARDLYRVEREEKAGIGYRKDTKKHTCKVQVLEP